ncbi:MAG: division/cell wall cluster transcriptional repressor MraZ [Bacteroidetes bacterium]|nr:division/cell wall cluster transcriptional repressor MraZ [Bacteroidota bacterium]MCL2302632.1 division/cell wall cluster transcriptional repressor MraZ [Lentimicrobiaceae bacterium]
MSGFEYGFWRITIEKHGRLKLPTALLKSLPENERQRFWVTHGFGNHIMLWTETAYRAQMNFLNSLDRNIIENKRLRNAFLQDMAFVECDAQDRFVIPKTLMDYYNIEKELVVLLDNGQIEVWNAAEYRTQFSMSPDELERLNEKIHRAHQLNSFENN